MCGIVGYTAKRPVLGTLVRGLKRLEYRGYDSAGLAFFEEGAVKILKSEGRLERLEALLPKDEEKIHCGIGHTRWATHGKPTTQNAHPHRVRSVTLVHNGVVENYREIKAALQKEGLAAQSETDSEWIAALIHLELEKGRDLFQATQHAFTRIQGQCSVVCLFDQNPGMFVAARRGSPLALARDADGGIMVASDAQPLLEISQEVIFLEQEDCVLASRHGFECFNLTSGASVTRHSKKLDWAIEQLDKQGYPHFMLKEIHEQPQALAETLNGLCADLGSKPFTLAAQPGLQLLSEATSVLFLGCGSSWHAGLLGRYWMEGLARKRAEVELSSEFRYRQPVLEPGTLVIGISQSGETADTLAALRMIRAQGFKTLGITNVRNSSLEREVDACLMTCAGPEIGVASTKAFLTQLLVLFTLSGYLGVKDYPSPRWQGLFQDLLHLPSLLTELLRPDSKALLQVIQTAKALPGIKGFFFMGRGTHFPVALEGALKLKEIAYEHAEGYAAGELKHGPIAMIDEGMAVLVLAPRDGWRDKTLSNLEEVKARGAKIIGIGPLLDDDQPPRSQETWIELPRTSIHESLMPFLVVPLLQRFSYERALLKGTDVDRPRNLAKSVTVE